jgi:hypothetical protein
MEAFLATGKCLFDFTSTLDLPFEFCDIVRVRLADQLRGARGGGV